MLRSVEFKIFRGVSVKEIVSRLNDRDFQLGSGPTARRYVENAQGIVEELMADWPAWHPVTDSPASCQRRPASHSTAAP